MTLAFLKSLGFDATTQRTAGGFRVACTKCAALVVNGTPVHEHGCPNRTTTCEECGARVPARFRRCDACREDGQLFG